MATKFDPYRDWLGIPEQARPLDCYQLLGLDPFEADAVAISAAFHRQVGRIRQARTPEHAEMAEKLIEQLTGASTRLLDPRAKATYDAELSERMRSGSPPRVRVVASAPTGAVERDDDLSRPNNDLSRPNNTAPLIAVEATARPVRRRSSAVVLTVAAAGAIVVVVGVGLTQWPERQAVKPTPGPPSAPADDGDPAETTHVPMVTNDVTPPAPSAPVPPITDPEPAPVDPINAIVVASPPDEAHIGRVRAALTASREALADREFDLANDRLELAEIDAVGESLRAEVGRARTLRHFVVGFWRAVEEAAAGLDVGEELVWRNRRWLVVEAGRDRFVLRAGGQNSEFVTLEIPADLAAVLAERWLAPGADAALFQGSFLAVDPAGDLERARELYQQVLAGGGPLAGELLAELDAASSQYGAR